MFIKVIYYQMGLRGYASGEYLYLTKLPLKPGDKVIAPTTKNANQKALVTRVNIPKDEIPLNYLTRIKSITQYDVLGEQDEH